MLPDQIEAVLKGNNIPFRAKDIQHAKQFALDDGAILCAYQSGKIVWQGKSGPTRQRVEELLGQGSAILAPLEADDKSVINAYSNKVFIVYGHDVDAREQLELLLRRMKLEPLVLQNVPSGGQTIIEKLETNSDVTFACVLLTPDDEGHPQGQPDKAPPRQAECCIGNGNVSHAARTEESRDPAQGRLGIAFRYSRPCVHFVQGSR